MAGRRYGLEGDCEPFTDTVFGCDNVGWKRDFLHTGMELPKNTIFVDAEEMCNGATAMTHDGGASVIGRVTCLTGGWVCSQNSSQAPNRLQESDATENFWNESGETLSFFGTMVLQSGPEFGFGENVFALAEYV